MTDPKAIGIVLPPRQVAAAITDFHGYFDQQGKAVAELPYAQIERVADELYRAYQEGRRVFLFGNGGSAALASHLACDLGKGTILNGNRRYRVIALTDNVALISAWANDDSYENIFSQQVKNLVRPGDLAFVISGSGNSPNVLQ